MRHEKVDVIFQAAVEVFAKSGFDQAKMDDIAQVAGVAKGTIYYHFKSKEDVFVGLMNEGMENLLNCAKSGISLHTSPTKQLEALMDAFVRFFIYNNQLAKILLSETFGTKERQLKFRMKIRDCLVLIEGILRDGVQQGEFRLTHPQEMASAIFGSTIMVVLQKIYSLDEIAMDQLETYIPTLLSSLHQLLFESVLVKSGGITSRV